MPDVGNSVLRHGRPACAVPVPSTFRTVSGLVPNPIRPCVALVGVLAAWCLSASSPAAPPNIVVLVADDLGWNDVSLHGAEIPTPNIDRIANEGVELERFYVNPVCSPTRVALMSGKHPIRYGLQRVTIKAWTELGIPPSEETLPELLARGGYDRRGVFGKWHLGRHRRFHPLEQGFTEFVGHLGGAIDYFTHESLGRLDWHRGFALDREEGYSTRLIGKHAVRFIDASASAEPFFLYVPFNAVHTPNHVLDEHMRRNAAIRPENRRLKAAMTTSMDDEIGNILAALDDRGLAANTLVLFFSDNGGVPPAGSSNEPLRGRKHTLYEGGIRVVAAVRWPDGGLSGGRRVAAPSSALDVLPTLAAAAGVAPRDAAELDGGNVLDLWRAERAEREDFEYYGYFNGQYIEGNMDRPDSERIESAVAYSSEWKLIRTGPNLDRAAEPRAGARLELFRIREDPGESSDLSASRPEVVAEMLQKILAFRRLKPARAMPMPLGRPANWDVPPAWTAMP